MAKPIEGVPPFKGKAGTWLAKQLKESQPDPKKAELAHRDREMVRRHIKVRFR
jgi:hypothetical protein